MQHEKWNSAPGSRVGTPAYLAPEVILTTKGKTYNAKVGTTCPLSTSSTPDLMAGMLVSLFGTRPTNMQAAISGARVTRGNGDLCMTGGGCVGVWSDAVCDAGGFIPFWAARG